jgi:hypothetical protein
MWPAHIVLDADNSRPVTCTAVVASLKTASANCRLGFSLALCSLLTSTISAGHLLCAANKTLPPGTPRKAPHAQQRQMWCQLLHNHNTIATNTEQDREQVLSWKDAG